MHTVNETVRITVTDKSGELVGFTLPAFTQEFENVGEAIRDHLYNYLRNSLAVGEPTSVADFILWLIRRASETEPLTSDYTEEA